LSRPFRACTTVHDIGRPEVGFVTEPRFDVLVIGSGPAGATAAYRLARDGFKTLVLEKEKLPRYKACGGAVTEKLFRAVDFDVSPVVEDSITKLILTHHHLTQAQLSFNQAPVSLVMRDKFDSYLVEHAAQMGAVIHDGEAAKEISFQSDCVRVRTGKGEYSGEIIVGADGASGITSRAANLSSPRNVAAALEMEVSVSPRQLEQWRHRVLLDWGAIRFGYAWIFPKADHLSVGIGTYVRGPLYPRFAIAGGEPRTNLRGRLNEWIKGEETLTPRQVLVERGHIVPLGGPLTTLHGPRVVLTGDAGGLIEPLLAEGIYYALRSGQIAAEVIAEAFRREDLDLSGHSKRVAAEFGPSFERSAAIARLTYRFPRACLKGLALLSPARNSFGSILEGHDMPPIWSFVQAVGNWLESH
jgi:geranylgeranyl reductase family protein